MKPLALLLLLCMLTACKEAKQPNDEAGSQPDTAGESPAYPQALQLVLDAHGGLEQWKAQKTLHFKIDGGNGAETHTIDLHTRKDRIDATGYSMGFDGEDVWLADSTETYEGDPLFYHNLMFYFYAMPFVLADEGIIYGEAEVLEHNGISYPGIRINYQGEVGTSPKDEYYLYYDPETHRMTWLGYTVTYFTDAPSDDLHWVRYDDWTDVSGLLLPARMTWYNYEGRTIKEARETVTFEAAGLSESSRAHDFYTGPDNAEKVEAEN